MTPTTPYSADLGDRDPLAALRETPARIQAIAGGWAPQQFERPLAPGKWTARQILVHLAQCELAFGNRARMALVTPGYAAQNMDQDAWMGREGRLSGADALAAFVALARMNVVLFESLSADDRAIAIGHPEYGAITIDWVMHQMAGHQIHHLSQLDTL